MMKSIFISAVMACTFGLCAFSQGVKVGIAPGSPDQSAILDAESTEKGFLPPRMTTEQRDAINSPAAGLQVFNITTYCLNIWNGTQWREVCGDCTPPPPTGLSYTSNGPLSYCVGIAIVANNATTGGGLPTSYSISPALPTGLNFDSGTGLITGTPDSEAAAADFTVTATNGCGNVIRVLSIAVVDTPDAPVAAAPALSDSQIVWNWNTVDGATGYKWSEINNYVGATDIGNTTTISQDGFLCNSSHTIYVWAYNACGNSTELELTESTSGCPWTRIVNNGGDNNSSGTVSTSGYSEVLVFGVAPGGSGGRPGDDDGGGGGGSGAAQLNGHKIVLNGLSALYYSTPYPSEVTSYSSSGQYPGNLQIRENDSNGAVIFELNAGQNGLAYQANQSSSTPGGAGGASNSFSSSTGTNGGSGATRNGNSAGSSGSSSSMSAAGGGGGGAWIGPLAGYSGGISSVNATVNTYEGVALNIPFSIGGSSGGNGGSGGQDGQSVFTATGGKQTPGTGGGGAGGGISFFGSGNYYGAGGGGGTNYGNSSNPSGNGGRGGAAYLVIYAR